MSLQSSYPADRLAVMKSRIRGPFDNPPTKSVGVHIENDHFRAITNECIEEINVEDKDEGKATITLIEVKSGYSFDWNKDGEWKGILNTKGRKINIAEGWGNIIERTFTGYIDSWVKDESSTDTTRYTITCTNKSLDLKNTDTNAQSLSEGSSPLDAATNILQDANNQAGGQIPYNVDRTKPSVIGGDQLLIKKWNQIANYPNNIDDYPSSISTLPQYNYIVAPEMWTNKLLVYDYARNKKVTDHPFANFLHDGGDITDTKVLTNPYTSDPQLGSKVFMFGKVVSRQNDNLYDLTASLLDFGTRTTDIFTFDYPFFNTVNRRVVKACLGKDGNIYYTGGNNVIYKCKVDYAKRIITTEKLIDLKEITGVDIPSDTYFDHDLFGIFQGSIEVLYQKGNKYQIATIDIRSGKVAQTVESALEFNIPATGVSVYKNSFYFGGFFIVAVQFIKSTENNFNETEIKYIVIDGQDGRSKIVNLEGFKFKTSSKEDYPRRFVLMNDTLLLKPVRTYPTSNKTYTLYTHKIELFDGGYTNNEPDNIWSDPNGAGTYEPPQPINYTVPANQNSWDMLKKTTGDAGAVVHTDTALGETRVFYPQIKSIPTYIFETHVDIIEMSEQQINDVYNSAEIFYGSGSNSGVVHYGKGGNVFKRLSPSLTQAQAIELAKLIVTPEFRSVIKIRTRAVVGLKRFDTVYIANSEDKVLFRGIIKALKTEHSQTNYYWAEYEIMGHIPE
ncbi:hypothetical protein [Brevibacillus brevis]|uniref:hypothetical protein n=1 Tax=Brevibacillus brevis TaxID=1393 RepID=UPI000D10FAB2|nr:hypothetical protein [Brevibacillus brevis]PSJ67442.1 hypothetical protein C7J99_20845 [Brevibacillus brevis]RED28428.1 hypothetical protein DES34_108295 [Brevibacillus brevis]GEC90682.1 hypothetical protein BBR01nite_30130 [Brevibacillus brevis]VEF91123.1 Uncharacterised protein [Brevibacillus brevis]